MKEYFEPLRKLFIETMCKNCHFNKHFLNISCDEECGIYRKAIKRFDNATKRVIRTLKKSI